MTASAFTARRAGADELPAPVAAAWSAALLWLASQPWYQHLPWLDRATDVPFLLAAVMLTLLVVRYASWGLEWLALRLPRLLRALRRA